jgi:hypothetical protein
MAGLFRLAQAECQHQASVIALTARPAADGVLEEQKPHDIPSAQARNP